MALQSALKTLVAAERDNRNFVDLSNEHLSDEDLAELIPNLASLNRLWLSSNQLTTLPAELGSLTSLTEFSLEKNPWIDPPPEVVDQGLKGILTYLRSKATERSRQWISKIAGRRRRSGRQDAADPFAAR